MSARHRSRRSLLSTAPVAALALLLLIVLLCLTDGPTFVAAQYLTPSFVVGETIPVTAYIRVQRQTKGILNFIGGGGADDAEDDDEANNGNTAGSEGTVEREGIEEAMMAANAKGAAGVLGLPADADRTGTKHASQIARLIPQQQAPRFGVRKSASLPAKAIMLAAEKQLRQQKEAPQEESDLALRLSVGRGLNKETTWVPLVTRARQLYTGPLAQLLAPEFLDEVAARMAGSTDWERLLEADAGATAALPGDHLYYLKHITVLFGFKTGLHSRVTSVRFAYEYTLARPTALGLAYVWDEHRPYDPHRAIGLCCLVAVVLALVMMAQMVCNPNTRMVKQFRKRTVVVRPRDD